MDKQKTQVQFAIIAFGLVVTFYQIFFNSGADFGILNAMLGLTIGAVAGGIAFFVGGMIKK